MTTTTPGQHEKRPIIRLAAAAVVAPLLATSVATGLILSWRADLPDPVATHFGGSGSADGYSSITAAAVLMVGIGLGLTLIFGLLALCWRDSLLARVMAAVGTGTTVFVLTLTTWSTALQRELEDATQASLPIWVAAAAIGVALVVGLALWWLVPTWQTPAGQAAGAATAPVLLSAGERVTWTRAVGASRPMMGVIVASMAIVAMVTVLTRQWWLGLVVIALFVPTMWLVALRVTVDGSGLRIRGALGWPRQHIPLTEIAEARVAEVRGLRDFGGYGYRIGVRQPFTGVRAWVLRSGTGLLVERTDGSRHLVVIDDAETGAGLLTALREQRTPSPDA